MQNTENKSMSAMLCLSKLKSKLIISPKQEVCILRLNCLRFTLVVLLNFLEKCLLMQKQQNTHYV